MCGERALGAAEAPFGPARLASNTGAAMKTFKTRHQFYLPDDLSEALDRLCVSSGSSKTAVLTAGLKAVLERRAGHELDQRFGVRLDRMTRGQARLENKVDLL